LSAEYPGTKEMFHLDKASEEEKRRVIDADWRQYNDWLPDEIKRNGPNQAP